MNHTAPPASHPRTPFLCALLVESRVGPAGTQGSTRATTREEPTRLSDAGRLRHRRRNVVARGRCSAYVVEMGKYSAAMAKTGLSIPGPGACPSEDQIPQLLALTYDDDPKVRRLALKHLCPCRLQRQRDVVWDRIFEMTTDGDPGVRRDVVHAMTDGSPRDFAAVVLTHLEPMLRDADPQVRKYVRRTLTTIRRTGRINVN
jgi:hypothetical protein